jgi:hypothetical protein
VERRSGPIHMHQYQHISKYTPQQQRIDCNSHTKKVSVAEVGCCVRMDQVVMGDFPFADKFTSVCV